MKKLLNAILSAFIYNLRIQRYILRITFNDDTNIIQKKIEI